MGAGQISFGPFVLESGARTLRSGGKPVALGQRAFALLEALASADGSVDKAALMEAAWPGTIVEEGNLTVQIAALRKAMGTRPDGGEWIVTVPRVGYRLVREQLATATDSVTLPALAVLPFESLSGDPEQVHFADGIVDDLIAAIGRFRNLSVVARSSSGAYRGKSADAREVGKQLGVRYILEGSVRRAGQRIRVVAQLVDAATGAHLWAQTYEGDTTGIFDMQDAMTASTAAIVAPKVELAEIARSHRERPGSDAPYDLYLMSLERLYTQREADNATAIELLERIIATEPRHGAALAAAAHAYEHRFNMAWPPLGASDTERCLAYARAALETGKDDALILGWSGLALQSVGRELDVGLEILKRAALINPNDVRVLVCAGVGHLWGGTLEDATAMFTRAITLSPADSLGAREGLANIALIEGEFEQALERARAAVLDDLNHDFLDWITISALAHLGRMDEAQRALRSYLARVPGMTVGRFRMNYGVVHRDEERSDVLVEGLRLAGLPEN